MHCKFIILIFKCLVIIIPYIFDTLLWYTHKLHCLKLLCINILCILYIGHVPDDGETNWELAVTCNDNTEN